MDESAIPVFKLADLVKLYSNQLEQLGLEQHAHPLLQFCCRVMPSIVDDTSNLLLQVEHVRPDEMLCFTKWL